MTAAQEWLKAHGCPDHVVRLGAEGCVHSWELTGRQLAEGWSLGLESYLNDLDGRQLLFEMEQAGLLDEHELKRVHLADHSVQASTNESDKCVWGEETATVKGWTSQQNWWYWRELS